MDIVLLHVSDCPNVGLARERVAEASKRAGVEVHVEEVLVADASEAEALGFSGSPTILLDGSDPFATGGGSSLACRLYRTADGVEGSPTVEALVAVLSPGPAH